MKRNDHPTIGRRGRLARSLATATSLARSFEPETDRPSVEKSRQFIGGRHCTDCPKYHGAAARQPACTALYTATVSRSLRIKARVQATAIIISIVIVMSSIMVGR